MVIRPILCGLAGVLADGVTLAAEILCPRDHVGERRHRAAVDALAGEPELTDDELTAVRGLIQERYETTPDEDVVDAAIHCDGCQCPWVHDDDTPITEACADRDAPREDDADPPTAPSRGDRPAPCFACGATDVVDIEDLTRAVASDLLARYRVTERIKR